MSLKTDLIYGPLQSRRLGLVLEVNPLGASKICSFNCGYCNLGSTELRLNQVKKDYAFPTPDVIAEKLSEQLLHHVQAKTPLTAISISGNGEPTLHPEFEVIIDRLLQVRNRIWSSLPIVVLTNGARLDERKIVEALNKVEECQLKVDAGNDRALKKVNAPLSRTTVSSLINGAQGLKNLSVQAFFAAGSVDNTSAADVEDWIEVVGLLRPRKVYIHGCNQTPWDPSVQACPEEVLDIIASKLERRTQIKASIHP